MTDLRKDVEQIKRTLKGLLNKPGGTGGGGGISPELEQKLSDISNILNAINNNLTATHTPYIVVLDPMVNSNGHFFIDTLGVKTFIVKVVKGTAEIEFYNDSDTRITLEENSNLDTFDMSSTGPLSSCEVRVNAIFDAKVIIYMTR